MVKGDTHKKKHVKNKFIKYEFILAKKDEGEFYAKVLGILNGDRIKVKDTKDNEYQIIIRGNFFYGSKKENLNFLDCDRNDYWVLVQPGISPNQYFLKHIYSDDDKKKLYERNELTAVSTQNNILEINNEIDDDNDVNSDGWIDNI